MKISRIFIYPVKSLAGISLESSKVLQKGLELDRRWMLMNSENQFMTQREYPKMTLIKTGIVDGMLELSYNGSSIRVDPSRVEEENEVNVWDDHFPAFESDPEVNDWISEQLDLRCRLVHMKEDRTVRTKLDRPVSFADGYPFLVLGESSMEDLNQRLDEPLSILRFRPNIVFEGGEPFEEDHWKRFRIGNLEFEGVKPCVRCTLTTVDPETSEKGVEPLRTLSTYRKIDNGVIFGLNAFASEEGIISVGDSVIKL